MNQAEPMTMTVEVVVRDNQPVQWIATMSDGTTASIYNRRPSMTLYPSRAEALAIQHTVGNFETKQVAVIPLQWPELAPSPNGQLELDLDLDLTK